jgi:hemerythrin-like metal-binding protein
MKSWTDIHLMDVEDLDRDHKMLLRIAEKIADKVDNRDDDPKLWSFLMNEGLKYLGGYYRAHTEREEEYMREINYAHYEEHKKQHDQLKKTMQGFYKTHFEEGKVCDKHDVLHLLGSSFGWQLMHIATDDMAIVGKGILTRPPVEDVSPDTIVKEIDAMMATVLRFDARTKIMDAKFRCEKVNKPICQKVIYEVNGKEVIFFMGIEREFLLNVAEMFWTDKRLDAAHVELMQWAMNGLGIVFWRNVVERLSRGYHCTMTERVNVEEKEVRQALKTKEPALSMQFETTKGQFFLICEQ